MRLGLVVALYYLLGICPNPAFAVTGIYSAPVIVPGSKIRHAARYPIKSYRLFKSDAKGKAVSIPFQIDELNQFGDYVLDQGSDITKFDGNGIFDLQDELVYMGDDVGPASAPKKWDVEPPHLIYEIKHEYHGTGRQGAKVGAVYLGVYFGKAPPLSTKNYVVFNPQKGQVQTSRYLYKFDQKNYLVVNGVDMYDRQHPERLLPLIDSSTFYMKADLKYFLTLEVFHKDIESYLEAYKVGPIRAVVRVSFFYRFLKINFELGMYTEVSLFSNSVILPAIMYNPLNGDKSLNQGSGFYYGFAITENPSSYKVETNIPTYEPPSPSLLQMFRKEPDIRDTYWLSIVGQDRMMYFEVTPSKEMLARKNVPSLYQEPSKGSEVTKKRDNKKAQPLGKSPVNLALYFDLSRFTEGEHRISFRLYFDNIIDPAEMENYKQMNRWDVSATRL